MLAPKLDWIGRRLNDTAMTRATYVEPSRCYKEPALLKGDVWVQGVRCRQYSGWCCVRCVCARLHCRALRCSSASTRACHVMMCRTAMCGGWCRRGTCGGINTQDLSKLWPLVWPVWNRRHQSFCARFHVRAWRCSSGSIKVCRSMMCQTSTSSTNKKQMKYYVKYSYFTYIYIYIYIYTYINIYVLIEVRNNICIYL